MQRRQILMGFGACAMPGMAAAVTPPAGGIGFQVLRNGNPIGEHRLSFSQSGDELTVTTSVALRVTLAGLTLFHYRLNAVEQWRGDVFQSLDSVVDYDGDPCAVHAERVGDGYGVSGTNHDNPGKDMARYLAPPDLLPLTYWNKRMIYGTVLNIQTAHSYRLALASPGWNDLPMASGGSIVARRYDLTGKLNVSVWYDKDDVWSGLAFQKNGSITYEKLPG